MARDGSGSPSCCEEEERNEREGARGAERRRVCVVRKVCFRERMVGGVGAIFCF